MSNPKELTILIASSDDAFRARIGEILRNADFQIHEAATFADAVQFVRDRRPPLAVVSIYQAHDFGAELCREIKAEANEFPTSVLQFTPDSRLRDDGTLADSDCEPDAVFTEPFYPRNFLSHIRTLLRFKENGDDLYERGEKLRESDERYRAFIRLSGEGIWRVELDAPIPTTLSIDEQIELAYRHAYIAECNDAMARMYGLPASDALTGARLGDLFVREDPKNYEYLRAFMANGYRLDEAESHERDAQGNDVYFLNNLVGIVENERLVRVWGTQRDVTVRKRAEQAVSESEEKYRLLTELSAQVVWLVDARADVIYVNQFWRDYSGTTFEETRARGAWETSHPDDLAAVRERFFAAIKTGTDYEVEHRIRRRDGAYRWFLTKASPVRNTGGEINYWLGVSLDIHERRAAEEKLRESEEKYRGLVELSGQIIYLRSAETGAVEFVNHKWREYTGLSMEDMRTRGGADLLHPDDRERVANIRLEHIRRGAGFSTESRLLGADGEYRWFLTRVLPLKDDDGNIKSWLGMMIDIHEEKLAEDRMRESLERAEAAQREAELANRAKDEFLGVLSHELRTPLNAMFGWVKMLSSGTLDAAMQARAVEVIERNIQLQSKLIEDILDVSRIISGKIKLDLRPLNLVSLVKSVLETARPAAALKQITLAARAAEEDVMTTGDAERLQQVLGNLISNAVKFTPPGGDVTVTIERCGETFARVSIADTGQGIAPDFVPFVFDRFRQADSSTKRRHGGLGLGLAIVKHIVELHGGQVSAASAGANLGATFTIELPLLVEHSASNAEPAAANTAAAETVDDKSELFNKLRVLIIEDEADAAEVLRVILAQEGAQVNVCGAARDALAALEKDDFDLILSDIGMPEMDGIEFIQTLRGAAHLPERTKRLPAVAITAYASAEDRSRIIAAGFDECLAKPASLDNLQTAIGILKKW